MTDDQTMEVIFIQRRHYRHSYDLLPKKIPIVYLNEIIIVYDEIITHDLIKYFMFYHRKNGEIFIFIPTENQTTEFVST